MSKRLTSFSNAQWLGQVALNDVRAVWFRVHTSTMWGQLKGKIDPLRERSEGGTDGSATQRNWLPIETGGGATGSEELPHPSSQLPDQLLVSPPLSKWAVSLSSLTLLRGIAVNPGKVPALQATQVALKRAKGAVTETVTSCLNTEQEMSNGD